MFVFGGGINAIHKYEELPFDLTTSQSHHNQIHPHPHPHQNPNPNQIQIQTESKFKLKLKFQPKHPHKHLYKHEKNRIKQLEAEEKHLLAQLASTRKSLQIATAEVSEPKENTGAMAIFRAMSPGNFPPSQSIRDAISASTYSASKVLPVLTRHSELPLEVGLGLGLDEGKRHLLPVFQMPSVKPPLRVVNGLPREKGGSDAEGRRVKQEAEEREQLRSVLGLTAEEADLFDGICPPPPENTAVTELLPELRVQHRRHKILPAIEESERNLMLEETYGGVKRRVEARDTRDVKQAAEKNGVLRARLSKSMKAVQQYTQRVQRDLAEIKQICPVTDIRAQRYLRKWGMSKLETAINRYRHQKLKSCLSLWREHIKDLILQDKRNAYLMLKAAQKLKHLFIRVNRGRHRRSFYKWKDWVAALRKQEEAEELTAGAIAVQRCVRRRNAARHVHHRIEAEKARAHHAAASRIQALLRARAGRRRARFLQEKKSLHVACVKIQRNFRKNRARRLQHLQNQAALKVQCAWRRRHGKLALHLLKQGKREVAAVKLQAHARRRKAKRDREMAIKHHACIKLQRLFRGRRGRRAMEERKQEKAWQTAREEQVALKLQAVFRGHRGRLLYQLKFQVKQARQREEEDKITKLQAVFRGRQGRRTALRKKEEVTAELKEWAKEWQEFYDENIGAYAFHNLYTQEIVYDPPLQGFIKADGKLALSDGRIVDDVLQQDGDGEAGSIARKCVECEFNEATRNCEDCEDEYCDACYEVVHEKGKFASHAFHWVQNGGPIEDHSPVAEEEEHEWDEYFDEDSGYPYWYNLQTGDTVWENPYAVSQEVPPADDEPAEWEEYFDEAAGLSYWYNPTTQETSWNPPGQPVEGIEVDEVEEGEVWEEHYDEDSGTAYWYNTNTGESSWESPYDAQ